MAKERKPMRRVSKKTAAAIRRMAQPRKDYLEEMKNCVVNGRPADQIHEMVGGGLRFITFEDDAFWLPTNFDGHQILQYESKAKQLARKFVHDPDRFSLQRFNEVYEGKEGKITKREIAQHLQVKE